MTFTLPAAPPPSPRTAAAPAEFDAPPTEASPAPAAPTGPAAVAPAADAGGAIRVAAASVALRRLGTGAFAVAEGPDGPLFPNGFVPVPWASGTTPADEAAVPGGAAREGPGGGALLQGIVVARRWWDPRVRVGPLALARVGRFLTAVDPIACPQAPEEGIGWGPGLTPAGDDVVVGMLLAYRAIGADAEAEALAAACADGDTSPFSRSLLNHAARGEAVRPLLDLLRALGGHGDLDRGLLRLAGFGATSGRHLIEGVRRVVIALPPPARA